MNIYVRIQDSDLLKYLDDSQAERVGALSGTREYRDGEALFQAGNRNGDLVEIVFGTVTLWGKSVTGQSVELGSAEAGEVLGEASFALNVPQPYTATASGVVRARIYPADDLRRLISGDPGIGARLNAALNDSLCRRHVQITQRQSG